MRTFEKSDKLHGVCYDVRGPVLDEAKEMERRGETVLHLNIGNPAPFGFRAPQIVLDSMEEALADPMSQGYSDSKGLLEAREEILQYHMEKGLPGLSLDHIYIGNGVSEMISLSLQALLNNGDEILIPAPDYPLWTAAAKLAGGNPVHYICDESSGWYPDIEDMEKKITDKTKGIVVINPNNPTGALYPKEILEKIVELARKHELMIFADEIYDRLVLDGKTHTSIASLAPDIFVVTFNGLPKRLDGSQRRSFQSKGLYRGCQYAFLDASLCQCSGAARYRTGTPQPSGSGRPASAGRTYLRAAQSNLRCDCRNRRFVRCDTGSSLLYFPED